ncbi:MAG: STM3941 family protein [Halopseudomonas aestusnigri]
MDTQSEKAIPLSKVKLVFFQLLALALVGLGASIFTLSPEELINQRGQDETTLMYSMAVILILLCGGAGVVCFMKLLDTAPGLTLSTTGFTDNSSSMPAEFIPWEEVTELKEFRFNRQKIVSIHIKNPEIHLRKGNILQRLTNRAVSKASGTPINISANSLKTSYNSLVADFERYFKHSQNQNLKSS